MRHFFYSFINSSGKKDIVVAAYDGTIAVYDYDGNFLDGWPVTVTDGNEVSSVATCKLIVASCALFLLPILIMMEK